MLQENNHFLHVHSFRKVQFVKCCAGKAEVSSRNMKIALTGSAADKKKTPLKTKLINFEGVLAKFWVRTFFLLFSENMNKNTERDKEE